MNAKALKQTIDRMVEDSIRRILPEVVNEVLLKTIANAGIVRESAPAPARRPQPQQVQRPAAPRPRQQQTRRPSSLSELLDPSAGSEFFQDPREAARQQAQLIREQEAALEAAELEEEDAAPAIAQRVQHLPPMLQQLAQETLMEGMDDDGIGEMWDDGEVAPSPHMQSSMTPSAPALNLEHAARVAKVDFSRAAELIGRTEKVKVKTAADLRAEAEFEQRRIEMERAKLNSIKVG